MSLENMTLGALLEDPRIAQIAPDAIRCKNLKEEPVWEMTLATLRREQLFSGDIARGMERLYRAADTGKWYYPLYSPEECRENPAREDVNIVWLPSPDPKADERPFILLVPGGGFVNVWNINEGWSVAAQFNDHGYHVFVLTYQVEGEKNLLEKDMQDFAAALRLIREHEKDFHVHGDRYITCGFSAGGYLVCLWNTKKGYASFDLPAPQAVFPIYPVTTLKEEIRYGSEDPEEAIRLYGCPLAEARKSEYEITEHVEGFPPCAIFVAAGDDLVNPENSKLLAKALEAHQIPCRLEIGPTGNHGFADGADMCMDGWIGRAVNWYEVAAGDGLQPGTVPV